MKDHERNTDGKTDGKATVGIVYSFYRSLFTPKIYNITPYTIGYFFNNKLICLHMHTSRVLR